MSRNLKRITITRIDACRRQLETAILLYFMEGDDVSIHTLSASAVEMVRAAAAAQGIMNLRNVTDVIVKPQYRKEVRRKIKESEGFFKHGGKNLSEEHVFVIDQTEGTMIDGCLTYEGLAGKQTPLMLAFSWWFLMNNPSVYKPPTDGPDWFRALASLPTPSRKEYFAVASVAFHITP